VTPTLDSFDTVIVRQGAVQSRSPLTVPPRAPVAPHRVMRLSQIDLSRVPALVADARKRVVIPEGEAEMVTLSSFVFEMPSVTGLTPEMNRDLRKGSDLGWRSRPHWTVHIKNERHARGNVSYSLDGVPLETIQGY
jgi:hypothetical protein